MNNDEISLQEARRQLEIVTQILHAQQEKLRNLEIQINKLSSVPAPVAIEKEIKIKEITPQAVVMIKDQIKQAPIHVKKSDMEMDFGRNWLSRIGIAVLALGVAFLISYSFKYFGPFLKIGFGFLSGGALFYAGVKLETRERMMHYGRALLGGAWAIFYFTTYAMYHFEASRIITDQGLDLVLLAFVVLGMLAHALKYKSEGMMAVVLFVAYLTSTIGQITVFTVLSNIFLALLVLFLVYKFQWLRILSFGIVMTYLIHLIWVAPKILGSFGLPSFPGQFVNYESMNLIFLSAYGLVFFIGTHLIRPLDNAPGERRLASINFANIVLYSVLAYPFVLRLFYAERFVIVLIEGLVFLAAALIKKMLKQEKMYQSDIIAAVFAISFCLSLKFLPSTTLLLWILETPFLLLIGTNFKERIFCYFSYALSVLVALRLIGLSFFGGVQEIYFCGIFWPWSGFMCFWAGLSQVACFYLTQRFKQENQPKNIDLIFDHIFSYAACWYLSISLWSFIHQPWIAFTLSMETWALLLISGGFGLKRFRARAYVFLTGSTMVFLSEHILASSEFLKWFIVSGVVLSNFGVYHAVKFLKGQSPEKLFFENEPEAVFALGLFLLVLTIYQYVNPLWISLSSGIASVALIVTGFINGNKTERLGGMGLLALTLARVVFVDLAGLEIIFKIITLIVLGALFLGVSYIYNRYSVRKN